MKKLISMVLAGAIAFAAGEINVVSREEGSGTRGAFIELFGIEQKNDAGEKVDYTTEDCDITNSTSVMLTSVSGNGAAICAVADTGIGIPIEHQARVFERFYRVDRSHSRATGGTGLGLAIVKHVAQIHRAQVNLESAAGEGTTVSVKFVGAKTERAWA